MSEVCVRCHDRFEPFAHWVLYCRPCWQEQKEGRYAAEYLAESRARTAFAPMSRDETLADWIERDPQGLADAVGGMWVA